MERGGVARRSRRRKLVEVVVELVMSQRLNTSGHVGSGRKASARISIDTRKTRSETLSEMLWRMRRDAGTEKW